MPSIYYRHNQGKKEILIWRSLAKKKERRKNTETKNEGIMKTNELKRKKRKGKTLINMEKKQDESLLLF